MFQVSHLENMLTLKDSRIKDLTQQLNVLANSSKPLEEKLKNSRFFSWKQKCHFLFYFNEIIFTILYVSLLNNLQILDKYLQANIKY